MSEQKSNHLIHETSPYLLQHAHNPVDWYPWGEEALKKAREENKPILVSIGYAACHWCHVMAHESFEDEETASLMNKSFINIKVDREERPDLDKIYQAAHYLLTRQRGGWPLTIFLTPDDLVPFFSGTYFPLTAKYQLPSFQEILQVVSSIYENKLTDIKKQNTELKKILHFQTPQTKDIKLDKGPLLIFPIILQESYDPINGGFFGAPKFPHPSVIEFLLRYEQDKDHYAKTTLIRMGEGGIFDQLRGGFFRYSIDEKWEIPHFEKMSYDNSQLLGCYALANVRYQDPFMAAIAKETANWVIEEMQSKEGGYYSSIDADTEGKEGKFYLWTREEIENLLSEDEYAVVELHYGLDQPPNFEKKWHLYVVARMATISKKLKISLDIAQQRLISAKQKLLTARNKRPHPARDEKILTAWNGLMIRGMMMAGDLLQEERFISSADAAIQFIQQKLWKNKKLLASYKDGKAHLNAYLDDYAFLLDALLTSLQVKWDSARLLFAIDLADALLAKFEDEDGGGFFFTSHDHEALLYRPKTMMDEAIPAGNGIAIKCLLILGHLIGDTRYLDASENALRASFNALSNMPLGHASMLTALKDFLYPPKIIIVRGTQANMDAWRKVAKSKSLNNLVYAIPNTVDKALPVALAEKKTVGDVCAYICQGRTCSAVVKNLEEFKSLI